MAILTCQAAFFKNLSPMSHLVQAIHNIWNNHILSRNTEHFTLQMLYTDKANILFWGYSVPMNLLALPNFCSNEVLHFGFHGNYVVISHKMAILIQFFCCMRFNSYCQQFHSLKVIKNVVWLKRFGICLNLKRIQELNSLPIHLFQDSQHLTILSHFASAT